MASRIPLGTRIIERARNATRPAVRRLRFEARRVGRILRPPEPWDGTHHPAVLAFRPFRGESNGRYLHDWLGTKIDPAFRAQFRPDPPGPVRTAYPAPSSTYFELAFVLEAVLEAVRDDDRPFTMIELGAGYGPWLATAAAALAARGSRRLRLVGVEMEPQHFAWMVQHLRVNEIDANHMTLLNAAVSDVSGEALFVPHAEPDAEYGLRLLRRISSAASAVPTGARLEVRDGRTVVRVPCVTLAALLEDLDRVDLLHVDVQGEEWRVLEPAAPLLRRKVRRLLVATHARSIQRNLLGLLAEPVWERTWSFRMHRRERTPFGDVQFLDGLVAVVNRELGR